MDNFDDVSLSNIKKYEILHVMMRALRYIDSRLVDHGERVAYIIYEMLKSYNEYDKSHMTKLFILSVLHDIGAYKTEEIDKMIEFETNDTLRHTAYGYVFLNSMTHLGELSQAILYHHTPYKDFKNIDCTYPEYAQIIFLADRIDVLIATGEKDINSVLKKCSGNMFNPKYVDLFFMCDEKNHIVDNIVSKSYKQTIHNIIEKLDIDEQEIIEYLKFLVYSIDFRSEYTVTHTATTVSISVELAKIFKLSKEQINSVLYGAFLHDVGKIAIPVEIIEKAGKLTDEEMVIMKTHIIITREIIEGMVSSEICEISSRHHEKINGTGYPNGLYGDELTLSQRIVAVADVLSALTNKRSYKDSYPKEKIISILSKMRDNGELCPTVVNTLLDNYDQILQKTEEAHDPIIKLYKDMSLAYTSIINKLN